MEHTQLKNTFSDPNPVELPSRSRFTTVQVVGSLCTALGAGLALFEGLHLADISNRFFAFSALLIVVALLGIFLSSLKSDRSGARLLIGTALFLTPAFWAQLGALVTGSMLTAAIGYAIGILIITPLLYLAARIFIPERSSMYSAVLLLSGLVLTAPYRTGTEATILLMGTSIALALFDRHMLSNKSGSQTLEALVARGVPLLSGACLFARDLYYGGPEEQFLGSALALSGGALYLITTALKQDTSSKSLVLYADLVTAAALATVTHYFFPTQSTVIGISGGAYLYLISRSHRDSESYRSLGLLLSTLATIFGDQQYLLNFAGAAILPVLAILYGLTKRSVLHLIVGLSCLAISWGEFIVKLALETYEYRWFVLMATGVALVFGSSFLQTRAQALNNYWLVRK